MMFQCKNCRSNEFQLMLQPNYQGTVEVGCNEFDEVVITVNQQTFIADLMFMNQFAVCQDCGAIKSWDYFFPEPEARKAI
ncbi:MAG TPA: hypothetical protein V6C99_00480 [Oculatellaceae cyanobacterium]|jgi:hypothetical protein